MANYKEILSLFTLHEGHSVYALSQPFYSDDYAVGTDARICCLVNRDKVVLDQPDGKLPNIKSIIPKDWPSPKTISTKILKNSEADEKEAAFRVELSKEANAEDCNECGGFGTHKCSCGDEHDCPKCDGEGEISDDTALTTYRNNVALFGKPFGYHYITKIRQAAEVLKAETCLFYDCGQNQAGVFVIEDFTIVLMPVANADLAHCIEINEN